MPGNKTKELSVDEKQKIANYLLANSEKGKLKRGFIKASKSVLGKSVSTISRIWRQVRSGIDNGSHNIDLSKKKNKCGRKKLDREELKERIRTATWRNKQTLRSLGSATGISSRTLNRMLKTGDITRTTTTLKPLLSPQNKADRMVHCLSMIDQDNGQFSEMNDMVHVDEKWFYLVKDRKRYYHLNDETAPHRSVQSKRFITKVMFLCAVARPRYDYHRKRMFDGKLGIWPFITKEPAKRRSINRERGTLVTKPLNVTGAVYSNFMKEKVLPAIKDKWPTGKK